MRAVRETRVIQTVITSMRSEIMWTILECDVLRVEARPAMPTGSTLSSSATQVTISPCKTIRSLGVLGAHKDNF